MLSCAVTALSDSSRLSTRNCRPSGSMQIGSHGSGSGSRTSWCCRSQTMCERLADPKDDLSEVAALVDHAVRVGDSVQGQHAVYRGPERAILEQRQRGGAEG